MPILRPSQFLDVGNECRVAEIAGWTPYLCYLFCCQSITMILQCDNLSLSRVSLCIWISGAFNELSLCWQARHVFHVSVIGL